jgi:NAD(P)-dependent dehydrogenase (short-subunit alcohol dehydrogenase family)
MIAIQTRRAEMIAPTSCYVCGVAIGQPHPFYKGLCPSCGTMNWGRRNAGCDLSGYTAVVTGARVKIGYQTALKLLRCGARVVATTRFEADALERYSRELDYPDWRRRLSVFPADFRSPDHVEQLLSWVRSEFKTLDILINNAAQTVRRPPAFYRHLVGSQGLPLLTAAMSNGGGLVRLADEMISSSPERRSAEAVALMSQVPLVLEDYSADDKHFPPGVLDKDAQQSDRRSFNSWMMELGDVTLVEMLEVLLINVVAPFRLCGGLKDLLSKEQGERPSFVVNVSAMEGNFYDPRKDQRHPHTNMAKAALNMMTRTSSPEFAQRGIYMTAVDPGWITNEKPFPLDQASEDRRTVLAIDEIDGASRICDPVFRAINTGEYLHGVLLKNYAPFPW